MRDQMAAAPGTKRRTVIIIILAVAIVALACVAVFMVVERQKSVEYVPPSFEAAAVEGTPTPPETLGYSTFETQNGWSVGLCGNIYQQEDGALKLYLTNPDLSGALLMAEVVDKSGNVYYKSGLLKENEYVESLPLLYQKVGTATDVSIKVYAFEPGTYYSQGVITIENILQPY